MTLGYPFSPPLDPATKGVRIVITDATSQTVIDAVIPGGAYYYATRTGWKVNRSQTTWTYRNGLGGIQGDGEALGFLTGHRLVRDKRTRRNVPGRPERPPARGDVRRRLADGADGAMRRGDVPGVARAGVPSERSRQHDNLQVTR